MSPPHFKKNSLNSASAQQQQSEQQYMLEKEASTENSTKFNPFSASAISSSNNFSSTTTNNSLPQPQQQNFATNSSLFFYPPQQQQSPEENDIHFPRRRRQLSSNDIQIEIPPPPQSFISSSPFASSSDNTDSTYPSRPILNNNALYEDSSRRSYNPLIPGVSSEGRYFQQNHISFDLPKSYSSSRDKFEPGLLHEDQRLPQQSQILSHQQRAQIADQSRIELLDSASQSNQIQLRKRKLEQIEPYITPSYQQQPQDTKILKSLRKQESHEQVTTTSITLASSVLQTPQQQHQQTQYKLSQLFPTLNTAELHQTQQNFHPTQKFDESSNFDRNYFRKESNLLNNFDDMYFFGSKEMHEFSLKKCKNFFRQYAHNDSENIGPQGIERLCYELGVSPNDSIILALSWKLNAKVMGIYTLEEWTKGMADLKCDNINKLKKKISYLQSCLDDHAQFRLIFRYSFDFAKEQDQRCIDVETAKQMLTVLLQSKWSLLNYFLEFLTDSRYRVMNKDQYYNVLDFYATVNPDLTNYDENGAWPVMLDEFVEWCRQKKGFKSLAGSSSNY